MESLKFSEQLRKLFESASLLAETVEAAAILLMLEGGIDWNRLKKCTQGKQVVVVTSIEDVFTGAEEQGFSPILLSTELSSSVYDRLSHAILKSVAEEYIPAGSSVVALYSGMDPSTLDSMTVIHLGEHLDRLTSRDLRKIEQKKVPLRTLKFVVDLAVEIGREGREGKMVGCLFVVGDHTKVMKLSKPLGFDPVRGYPPAERNLCDKRVQEGVKEIAQLDGAFIVNSEGIVEAACRHLESSNAGTLSVAKGLGARHWAAASISRSTEAVSVAVSQSSGTVRIFVNGEVTLRIESRHRNPMVWRHVDESE